jgi:hypothetical protein
MTPFGVWQGRSRGSIHESSQRQKEHQMRMRTLLTALAGIAALVALTAVPAGASPRGVNGQIAYERADAASPGDAFVYTASPDGTHEQQLVPGHTCCPSWSHSGSKLAIPYLTDDGRVGTATVNADGSGYTPLPIDDPTLNVGCGPWSPDDARFACESWDGSNPEQAGIYTIKRSCGVEASLHGGLLPSV